MTIWWTPIAQLSITCRQNQIGDWADLWFERKTTVAYVSRRGAFYRNHYKGFQKVFDSLPQQHPPPEKYIECRVATTKPFA